MQLPTRASDIGMIRAEHELSNRQRIFEQTLSLFESFLLDQHDTQIVHSSGGRGMLFSQEIATNT